MSRNKLIIVLATLLTLSACTDARHDKDPRANTNLDVNAIQSDKALTPAQKAEQLALAAEQLVGDTSFMYADEVAKAALAHDANNKRAQLIQALVGPAMMTKGIYARVKTLASRNAESAERYNKFIADINETPNRGLKTFLMSGKDDIRTEKDIQNFFGSIVSAFDRLRLFLKANKDLNITLNVPGEEQQRRLIEKKYEECYWQRTYDYTYEYSCDASQTLEVKLARADMEGLQQMVAGYQIYLILMNAYSYEGAIKVSDKYHNEEVSSRIIQQELLSNAGFGTLRDAKGLNSILAMGIDAIAGVRWASKLQQELCPNGTLAKYYAVENRPGYALKDGICIKKRTSSGTSLEQILSSVELVLKGGLTDANFKGQQQVHKTQIKPAAFFQGSVRDIRNLGLNFDECGRVVSANDTNLGGVFVKKDANTVLALDKKECFE